MPAPGAGVGGGPDRGGAGGGARTGTGAFDEYIRLEPPGKERLFGTRDTERELEERMRQERKDQEALQPPDGRRSIGPVQFPPKPELTEEAYQPRRHAPTVILAEPSYVVYQRLYFEEKNAERYGWDLGPIQPLVSTGYFIKDLLCLPHDCATDVCRRFETNAGQCWPGDPVPYILYPPELSWSGLLAEVGVIALLTVAIP